MLCSLYSVLERRSKLTEVQGHVLLARRRIERVKQAYDESKNLLQDGNLDFISVTYCIAGNTEGELNLAGLAVEAKPPN